MLERCVNCGEVVMFDSIDYKHIRTDSLWCEDGQRATGSDEEDPRG